MNREQIYEGNIMVFSSAGEKRESDPHRTECAELDDCVGFEYVMVVPKKLTKHAQNVIYSRQATPLRYHLEGRFGSRTHQIGESHMGLPLTSFLSLQDSKAELEKRACQYDDLQALIDSDGVKFSFKPYHEPASHRARPPPSIDARIHPEREPKGVGNNEYWKKFISVIKSTMSVGEKSQSNQIIETTKVHQVNHLSMRKPPKLFTYAELFAGKTGISIRTLRSHVTRLTFFLLYDFAQMNFRYGWIRCCFGPVGWKMHICQ